MRDENHLFGHIRAVQAVVLFGVGDQAVHHLGHMAYVQAGHVEAAVGNFGFQQFGQRFHTAFGHFAFFFHHQGNGTHAHDHTVSAAVKGQGSFGDVRFRRSGAGGQESRQNPFGHVVVGRVVGADDDDAFAAAEGNPVLRHGNGLRRGSTGRA